MTELTPQDYWQDYKSRATNKARQHRRRAKRRGLPARFTPRTWMKCISLARHKCPYCGLVLESKRDFTLDHWIPLADAESPGTVPDNVLAVCEACNTDKSDQPPCQWLVDTFGPDRAGDILDRVQYLFSRQQAYFERRYGQVNH